MAQPQQGRGGLSLPEFSENESAKWKNFYSTKLPGTTTTPKTSAGSKSKNVVVAKKNENVADAKDDNVAADATENNNDNDTATQRSKGKRHKPLHRGKVREGELDRNAFLKKKGEEAAQKLKDQRERRIQRKKDQSQESGKKQSDFRSMQLALATPEDVYQFLQDGLFSTQNNNNNNNQKSNDTSSAATATATPTSTMSSTFSDTKNLGIFMQALLSTVHEKEGDENQHQQQQQENNKSDDAANESTSQKPKKDVSTAAILSIAARSKVIRDVVKNKQIKAHIWTLLALLHSVGRRSPGFFSTSPSTLKFVALCDSFGVADDKWTSDVVSPTVGWESPVLAPRALIRQIEEKVWFEYLCARVEVLGNAKDVQKFCNRILQQQKKEDVNDDDDDDEEEDEAKKGKKSKNTTEDDDAAVEEEDGVIQNSEIEPTKLALLASKFASKLLRGKDVFFSTTVSTNGNNNNNNEIAKMKELNINTASFCADTFDFLTSCQKALATLKKVSFACDMILEVLGHKKNNNNNNNNNKKNDDSDDSSNSDTDDEEEKGKATKKFNNNVVDDAEAMTGVPSIVIEHLESVSLRCQGGASEDEVALASARQLTAVAKFKACESAQDISRIVDEIVDPEENGGKEIIIRGDDVVSALAVSMNTLLGPVKRVVQFQQVEEEMLLQEEEQQRSRKDKKLSRRQQQGNINNNLSNSKTTIVKKTAEEEELEAELKAEMMNAATSAAAAAPSKNGKNNNNNSNNNKNNSKQTVVAPTKDDQEKLALQKRVMGLFEFELAQGRRLPRRAQAFLDRCRQELRRRPRRDEEEEEQE